MANGDGTQTAQATAAPTPQPPPPLPDHLSDLRIRPLDTESTWQTLKRNVTPEIDTSRSALGPGHEFDNSSPQQEGEQQYKETFGSPLERAYGHGKSILKKWEGQVSEKYLAPFRAGIDRIGDDLQAAAATGHTKNQGQLNPVTRLMVGGVGTLLKQVPVGRDVQETVQMSVTPPELGPEGRALSNELKAAEKSAAVTETGWLTKGGTFEPLRTGEGHYDAAKRLGLDVKDPKGAQPTYDALNAGHIRVYRHQKANASHFEAEAINDQSKGLISKALKDSSFPEGHSVQLEFHKPKYTLKEFDSPDQAKEWLENLGTRTEQQQLPPQPRLPDTGTHAAIKTDDGSIYYDDAPEKQRTHIMLAKDLGIPPERVVSGGWLQDGHYEASERSDAGRWGEQARAKAAVAEKRAARSAQNSPITIEYLHNTQRAPDLGSRFGQDVEPHGKYLIQKTPGSTTPEGWNSGKVTFQKPLVIDFGGGYQDASNWKKVLSERYDGKTGKALSDAIRKDGYDGIITKQGNETSEIVDLTSPAKSSELPVPSVTAESKARERAGNLKGLGIGLTEMNADDAKNWVGYTNQKSLRVYRGVDDPAHTIEPGDYVTTSKESAQNYGKHVQELEVSPEELRYVRGHKDGDPKRVGMGGQVELVYAPTKAPAAKQATDDQILNHFDKKYPAAKETVDGHTVREHVPNYDSISASLAPNYEVLDGVREIPMSHFDDPGSVTPRTKQLAADIKESGELNPLIVGIDHRGPYILEGGHRFDALRINKAKSFPAVVALDLNKGFRPNVEEELAAGQTETLYHGSPDVSKIDQLKPGSKGGYFGDGIYLTRDPNVARRFTKLEAMNPTLERNADGSFTDINTGKRIPGGKPGVLETTLKDARLKKITMDEMDAEIEKFRKPNGVIDLDGARNAIAQRFAKQGYDGFDVAKSKYFDEPQVVIFPSSAHKLSINKPEAKSLHTIEGAKPLADKLGAKVVGSVATGKTSADPYGINRGPKDLDLRIEGEYQSDDIQSKLKAEGYEFRGSSVLSPQEQKASGKNYGKPGWKRAEHFENSAGQKIDVWHDETGAVVFRNGRRVDVPPAKKLK